MKYFGLGACCAGLLSARAHQPSVESSCRAISCAESVTLSALLARLRFAEEARSGERSRAQIIDLWT